MKKKGYTLAESLIAIGIVGIVAALMLPLMNKYKPDADKALFVRTYDAIVETIGYLVSNEAIYPRTEFIGNTDSDNDGLIDDYIDYTQVPLLNDGAVQLEDMTEIGGNSPNEKLCEAIAYNIHSYNPVCSSTSSTITLINNVELTITNPSKYLFLIDVKLNKKNEDIYKVAVVANGYTAPYNQEAKNYISTRHNWKKSTKNASSPKDYQKYIDYWENRLTVQNEPKEYTPNYDD